MDKSPVVLDPTGWKYRLKVLLTPRCWMQLYPYSEAWDRELRRLMSEHRFEPRSDYTATIGGRTIWISNHPYASFRPYEGGGIDVRPSRATMLRAHDKLVEDLVAHGRKQRTY